MFKGNLSNSSSGEVRALVYSFVLLISGLERLILLYVLHSPKATSGFQVSLFSKN
jgi:hypothetical protein